MAAPALILASASPRRRDLLAALGISFEVVPSPLVEPTKPNPRVSPRAWAEALSYFKARSVAERNPGRWVLGADTIVTCRGRILGKPRDAADAREMLELQAGVESRVITGLSMSCTTIEESPRRIIASAVTRVWMRDDRATREAYLTSGDWSGKAGAYGIQDVGDQLVERIDGDFDNVVGLPCRLFRQMALLLPIAAF